MKTIMLALFLTLITPYSHANDILDDYNKRKEALEQKKAEIRMNRIQQEIAQRQAYEAQLQQQQAATYNRRKTQSNSNQAYWDRMNNMVGGENIAEKNRRIESSNNAIMNRQLLESQAKDQAREERRARAPRVCNFVNHGSGTGQIVCY